jgi:CubicO group peptidase (beta-lactamase class C family)
VLTRLGGGAFGTWFWIDPKNDVVVVGMIQNQNPNLGTTNFNAPKSTAPAPSPPTGAAGNGNLREISAKAIYAALKEK